VDLRYAQRRALQPFAEVGDVLAHEIARRGNQTHVAFFFEYRIDRHAQHDFGFARARGRFEQELENVVVEPGADGIDRLALIVGERKRFAGLDELVRYGDGLRVAVDGRPNLRF
jgi:hypothetical protein